MSERPPMCPGSLLLGNARALLDDTAGVLTTGYERWGPIFRIRAAWRQYTVIGGPEAGDFMAQGLDKAHLSRERLFGSVAREFGRADLVLKEIGPRHARLRPPLAVAYSRQVASPHVPAMVEAVRQHVRRWPANAPRGVVAETKQLALAQVLGAARYDRAGVPRLPADDRLPDERGGAPAAADRVQGPVVPARPRPHLRRTHRAGAPAPCGRARGRSAHPHRRAGGRAGSGRHAAHRRRGHQLRGLRSRGEHRLRRAPDGLHALRDPARRRAARRAHGRSARRLRCRSRRRDRRPPHAAAAIGLRRDAAIPLARHRHGLRRGLEVRVPGPARRQGRVSHPVAGAVQLLAGGLPRPVSLRSRPLPRAAQ